ncbi:MAG: signal transduction histidine kinase LytS [Bacteroidetes bacterium]|nr:signal transduction histidine kinase LytS [Bacteroidota bacterium]
MQKSNKTTNWKVAILFSAILPVFHFINNSQHRVLFDWQKTALNWVIIFSFLMICWHLNYWLIKILENKCADKFLYRVISTIVLNIVLLAGFIVIGVTLISGLEAITNRDIQSYFYVALKGFFSILLIQILQFGLNSNKKAQEVSMQNQLLKTENLRAQFEILRQQVNPHFLFNSLSTLRSMIHYGNENSETFVLKLSEVYRQLLQKRDKELISLQDELEFVSDYSYMLFTRFENMLTIKKNISEDLLSKHLPTFSLQILIENCIKHNIISKEKPLHIKIFNSGTECLVIENNLQPKMTPQQTSGFGIINLTKRYELLGKKEAVSVFSDNTVFRVKIKLMNA